MIDITGTLYRIYKRHFNIMSAVFLLMFIFFLIGLLVSIFIPRRSPVSIIINSGNTSTVGDIYDGVVVELEFISPEDSLSGVSLLAATYEKTITGGSLVISLLDENDQLISSKHFDSKNINDNSWVDFVFPEQVSSKGMIYRIRVETENIGMDMPITFWTNEYLINNVKTRVDGEEIYGTMIFSILCTVKTYPFMFDFAILVSISFILFINAHGQISGKKQTEERVSLPQRPLDA